MDNLIEVYNNGWDICNHTVNHTNLVEAGSQKAYDEIKSCSEWIKDHGFVRNQPQGSEYQPGTRKNEIKQKREYRQARRNRREQFRVEACGSGQA